MEIAPIRKFILIMAISAVGLSFGLLKYVGRNIYQHAVISQDIHESDPLPDLVPLAMYDIHLTQLNSRTVLKFTSAFWNRGRKQFELVADPTATTDDYENVYQRIVNDDGTEQRILVGNFLWHPTHNHYHYGDFANYIFSLIKPAQENTAIVPSVVQKTTFCLRDNDPIDLSIPGAPQTKLFAICGLQRQGVSIGWADVYKYTLSDQYIDVQDLPPGIYSFSFLLDPNQRFNEESKNNNLSTVLIDLDVAKYTAKVIGSAAPFQTSKNVFSDNILIKGEDREKIYVIHNNKKRWIRSEEIFNSYSYQWGSVYPLAESMVEFIPFNNLVRAEGTHEVYAINDAGYKRHIPSPEVFVSYGFTWNDIATINQTEMNIYPNSYLIMPSGSNQVYAISTHTKRPLGTFDSLKTSGFDLSPLHVINQTDFDSYIYY